MNILLDLLDDTIPDIRRVPVPPEADNAVLKTIIARGVLQPILVRPAGNRFEIVLGRRRARLARKAGLLEIPAEVRAMTDVEAIEAQVIENLQREAMHVIDQWRVAKDLLEMGLSIADAAMALGLSERQTRRMELLATLHPQVLALAEREMPTYHQLAAIASAPQGIQASALKAPHAVVRRDVNWHIIARCCRTIAIPKGRAIFDSERAGVAFIEDLFAEPGADNQFVTHDAAGFLAAQTAALTAQVDAARKRGERVTLAEWGRSDIVLPRGWSRRFGEVPKRPFKGADGPTKFVTISHADSDIGRVIEVVADPPPSLRRAAAAAQAAVPARTARAAAPGVPPLGAAAAEPPSADADDADNPELERAAITKRGLQMIAAAKSAALRSHLRTVAVRSPERLAECLVLALSAGNVHVYGETKYMPITFGDLVRPLVDQGGNLVPAEELGGMLAEALARMLVVTDPVTGHGSGDVAEWIGNALGADVALPRFDTEEFLATLSAEELRAIARDVEISVPKRVRELRAALVGNAPKWRPTTFGAPGPKPPPTTKRRAAHREEEMAE